MKQNDSEADRAHIAVMRMMLIVGLFVTAFGGWHWWHEMEIQPETVTDIGVVWALYALLYLTLLGRLRRRRNGPSRPGG